MKAFKILVLMLAFGRCALAEIVDPVGFYRSSTQYPAPSALLKWNADINGDGKNETFLIRKADYDADVAVHQLPSWEVFIANTTANTFMESTGIQDEGEELFGIAGVPQVDIGACFVGQVTELGKHALVTMQVDTPRVGNPIARIYAYTIEGDHLKRSKLAEYPATQGNPLFDKYLKEGKRTVITPAEINS
ncbi:MAG: hypothetical protein V4640_15750 [Verrucomicrobiota bacterium]